MPVPGPERRIQHRRPQRAGRHVAQRTATEENHKRTHGHEEGGDSGGDRIPYQQLRQGKGDEAREHTLDLSASSGTLRVELPAEPRRIDVDPQFDLFRRLDPGSGSELGRG